MVNVESMALLVTVMLPAAFPVAEGANVTFRVAVCPGGMIWPVETPLESKPGPERLTLETAMLEAPELLSVTARVLLLPTVTLPKLNLEGLAVRVAVPAGLLDTGFDGGF